MYSFIISHHFSFFHPPFSFSHVSDSESFLLHLFFLFDLLYNVETVSLSSFEVNQMKKNVWITGASRGIGRACALAFADGEHRLFLNGFHSADPLIELCHTLTEKETECIPLIGDISDSRQVQEMYAQIEANCDGIDILINNAGIAHFGLLCDLSDEDWDRIIRTNLSSVFYTCRAVLPSMISKKSGKILNVSSMWGRVGASCEVAYSASKAGVQGLTQALAKELAPSNIQVNAVACGVIDTDMNARLSETDRKNLAEEIPAGRFARPEEVANFLYDLSRSPEYLTGQVIGFDGGYI